MKSTNTPTKTGEEQHNTTTKKHTI
jgi:hypothetical protein